MNVNSMRARACRRGGAFPQILMAGALGWLSGCQAPEPVEERPEAIPRASLLETVQHKLRQAELALSSRRYEAAVQEAERLWKLIPDPGEFRGTVKERKILLDAAARSGEIPIQAWRQRGEFIKERKAILTCGRRYEAAGVFNARILRAVQEITRDVEMLKLLGDYRTDRQAEYRRWRRRLHIASALSEAFSHSGHNRTAISVLRKYRSAAEAEFPDQVLRVKLLSEWDKSWKRLGFEQVVSHAIQPKKAKP